MCCSATKIGTKSLRDKMLKNGGKMSFWKVIDASEKSIVQPSYTWKVGINEAEHYKKPSFPRNEFRGVDINEGIHVFHRKDAAIQDMSELRNSLICKKSTAVLLEVECDVADLLGSEGTGWQFGTAVFSKVTVTPKAWTKMKKCRSDYYLKRG